MAANAMRWPSGAHENEATLRSAHDRAVLASMTDPLTGLHNRRHVFHRLDDLLTSTKAMRIPLAVVGHHHRVVHEVRLAGFEHGAHGIVDQVVRGDLRVDLERDVRHRLAQ